MKSLCIVEYLDVEGNRLSGVLDGGECGAVDELILDCREEGLAIALSQQTPVFVHRGSHIVCGEVFSELSRRVLLRFKGSMQHRLGVSIVGVGRGPRLVSSIGGSCVVWC